MTQQVVVIDLSALVQAKIDNPSKHVVQSFEDWSKERYYIGMRELMDDDWSTQAAHEHCSSDASKHKALYEYDLYVRDAEKGLFDGL
jgi:hypothetical protein